MFFKMNFKVSREVFSLKLNGGRILNSYLPTTMKITKIEMRFSLIYHWSFENITYSNILLKNIFIHG